MKAKKHRVNEEFWKWWYAQMDRDYERALVLAERAWEAGRVALARDIQRRRKLVRSTKH